MSVHNISEEGYMTIFHPGNKGVTIHKPDTLNITMNKPLVIQGRKEEGQILWTIETSEEDNEINNIYNLQSTKQSIRYLHAATGIPVKKHVDASNKGRKLCNMAKTHPQNST
jgi:hypothetical protein